MDLHFNLWKLFKINPLGFQKLLIISISLDLLSKVEKYTDVDSWRKISSDSELINWCKVYQLFTRRLDCQHGVFQIWIFRLCAKEKCQTVLNHFLRVLGISSFFIIWFNKYFAGHWHSLRVNFKENWKTIHECDIIHCVFGNNKRFNFVLIKLHQRMTDVLYVLIVFKQDSACILIIFVKDYFWVFSGCGERPHDAS